MVGIVPIFCWPLDNKILVGELSVGSEAEDRLEFRRREALILFSAAGCVSLSSLSAGARASDAVIPAKPSAEALPIWVKLNADTSGRTIYAYTAGTVWGFKPQADDMTLAEFGKRLYGYHSLVVRKAQPLPDGSVALKSQSWTFYADPELDEITTTLHNPYSSEDVISAPMTPAAREQIYGLDGRIKQTAAPGISAEELPAENPFDMRVRNIGTQSFVSTTQFSRFKTPGITWFKLEADMMSYACSRDALEDPKATHIPSTWSHNLVAEWQTWMKMHGVPGHILFKGEGTNIASMDGAPEKFLSAMEKYYPGALAQIRNW